MGSSRIFPREEAADSGFTVVACILSKVIASSSSPTAVGQQYWSMT